MIRVGIVGATGYGGRELLRLLGIHPEAEVVAVASGSAAGRRLDEALPAFRNTSSLTFEVFDASALADRCDVVFVGVPGAQSMRFVAALRGAGVKVIDIGPDFRLKDLDTFQAFYHTDHTAPELVRQAVYGLVPLHRDAVASADLVAVPGCYPISAILPLHPFVPYLSDTPPVIDSISGISGAGRTPSEAYHFPEMNENVKAYKVAAHQHAPEIEQALGASAQVQFTPHVGPYTRGILTTITVRLAESVPPVEVYACYADEPFVRVLPEGELPEVRYVRASNFCDIGWVVDDRTGNVVLVSAIDNLTGGTAGMAVQCMNCMFRLAETMGLDFGGMAP